MSIDGIPAEHATRSLTQQQIFISYRHSDAQASTGRLADHLRRYYGSHRVYRDLDSNRPAGDFVNRIDEALGAACVVIPVIGPQWLTCTGADQRRRLDDPADLVRQEITRAIASGVHILPVLVEGAQMPRADQLPEPLQPLSRRHAYVLRDERWDYDFGCLLDVLAKYGIVPYGDPGGDDDGTPGLGTQVKQALTTVRRYERTMKGIPRNTYVALAGTVTALQYAKFVEEPQALQVRFSVHGRSVVARVLDAAPGYSSVVVEFTSMRVGTVLPALLLATNVFGAAAAAGVLALERRFAKGFLDNVQRMLEGRGVGEDSALPPGLDPWRKKRGRL